MKNAQKPDHASLSTLIGRLREGQYVIPDFQREFEWRPWDIRELMRSIFLDYYIGSLLLWKGKPENFSALSCEPIYGFSGKGEQRYIVLDGQQRLTALYYAFIAPDAPLPNRTRRAIYYIQVDKFMAEQHDEAFHYDWYSKRMEKLLSDSERQFAEHFFPCSVVGKEGWDLATWVQGYEKYWRAEATKATSQDDEAAAKAATLHADNAVAFGKHLKEVTGQYQVSYIELDQELGVDKVCDIFTQINSRGIRLDVFDLMNALLKPKGLQLKKLWREAEPRLEFVENDKMNVYILQVMSILRQGYCSPKYLYFLLPGQEKQVRDPGGARRKEVLVANVGEFETRWNEAVNALEHSIRLLQHPHEFGVTSSNYLPYVSILPVFAALQSYVETLKPEQRLSAQRKLRLWYWSSVFMNRYSGSVESTSARDYLDLRWWMLETEDEPSLITDFKTRFRNMELRKEVKSGTSVYNGIFNLLVLAGARDWISGNVPQQGELDAHHIVPASWGAKHVEGNLIHSILNRTPLTDDTNRHFINDKLPNEYLPRLIASSSREEVEKLMEAHFISPVALEILLRQDFGPDDFEQFIAERQRTLLDAIETLLVKERMDLPPKLRDLDAAIERTELKLRALIQTRLQGDVARIPSGVVEKVAERIGKALKKNAALDAEYYQTLAGRLEYCDLRELQLTISNATLWPGFTSVFNTKEAVAAKFDQLAELRNAIRHSRSVSDVTRMEGEAALVWFDQVLRNAA